MGSQKTRCFRAIGGGMLWFFLGGFLCSLISMVCLFKLNTWVIQWTFMSLSYVDFSAVFIMDLYSLLFFFVVILISSIIYIYSQYYMDRDKRVMSFLFLLSLFVLSMVFLIFSPSLIFLLLGWDGLGITSYLLVVYYLNYRSSVAGILTFLVNRFGDVFFFLRISSFYFLLDWNYYEHKYRYWFLSLVLCVTFITKSAQIPFSSWLPAAMAAPTPVSSLVHSSTLVTAGVYLLIRFRVLMGGILFWLSVLSIFTIIMAGVMANLDYDLKKIVAFSTLRQLGFIVSSWGCGLVLYAFFHLLTHALFKASLFMCSGVVIHSLDNRQDFRNSYSFYSVAPFLTVRFLVCLLCLCGFPFSSGFFSKDMVLDGGLFSFFFFFFFLVGVVLTFSYSIRFGVYLYRVRLNFRAKLFSVSEAIYYILGPVWVLVMFALVAGAVWSERVIGLCRLVIVRSGWKLFYWLVFRVVVVLRYYFMKEYFCYFRKYIFRHIWFIFELYSTRLFKACFRYRANVVQKIDQGWMEKCGPSGILQVFYTTSYIFLGQYVFFFLSVLLFFFWVI